MKIRLILLAILLLSVVSAQAIKVKCPAEVQKNSEFSCIVLIDECDGSWDLKFDLKQGTKNILQVWNPDFGKYKSGYYYLKNFLECGKEKEIKLKSQYVGKFNGKVIIRKNTKKQEKEFSLIINPSPMNKTDNTNKSQKELKKEQPENEKNILKERKRIILNSPKNKPELIYESKNSKILKYAPYLFALFLIFLLIITFFKS